MLLQRTATNFQNTSTINNFPTVLHMKFTHYNLYVLTPYEDAKY